ncbi:MAG TPA: carbohydrate porin, partial [Tepidisphaeraceae bacterium]|nr:carbohydrate porin [Tepidisphaeraceae bacterium]
MSRTALATAVLTFATAAPALADDDMPAPWHAWERATGDWAGVRPRLVDRGITVNAALTVDTFANVRGGADTEGVGVEHLFDLALTLDTERLLGHPGGTVYVLFQNHAGDRVSDRVGDLYGIGGLDADGRTQVSEAWFDQQLFDDRLRVRVGKIDAQMEFAAYNTLPIPAYPDPAFGFDAFVTPTDHTYVGFGFFDGSLAAGTRTGALGPAPLFDGDGGYFLIAEAGWRWEDPWAGRLGRALGGAWHHTGSLPRVTGVGTRTGDTGAYAAAEQTLWAPSADDDEENDEDEDDASARGVSAYVQYSYAG